MSPKDSGVEGLVSSEAMPRGGALENRLDHEGLTHPWVNPLMGS